MIEEMPEDIENTPKDDHRYFKFPYLQVFEGALYALNAMKMKVRYSNAYQGRVIGYRNSAAGGYLDITLTGQRHVTMVHVRVGSSTVTRRDDSTKQLRRRFFWELDDWLHKAGPGELLRVHKRSQRALGRRSDAWVPPQAAYKIDRAHPKTDPRGHRLRFVLGHGESGTAEGPPRGPMPG